MKADIEYCKGCSKNQKGVSGMKLIEGGTAWVCPECRERMLWAAKILELGTAQLVEKHPERYVKTTKYSVTPLVYK
jgi:hypothetical protein